MTNSRSTLSNKRGFTLIELVIVLVVLAIISVGITGFIRSSTQIFIDASERERLLREGSYVVERMNREISTALPNSFRLTGNAGVHCLQFVPVLWSTFYLTLPQTPGIVGEMDIVEMQDIDGNVFTPVPFRTSAWVYPTNADDVYSNTSNQRQRIKARSDDDDADGVVQLTLTGGFSQASPAKRVYISSNSFVISYCVRNNSIYRHESPLLPQQVSFASGGVLMAQSLANQLSTNPNSPGTNSTNPFRIVDASLPRNGYIQTQFIFTRDGENIIFTQEAHVPNVP
jgi:MSHA biogenesis protein MshO